MKIYTAPELIVIDLMLNDILTVSVGEAGKGDDWDWSVFI